MCTVSLNPLTIYTMYCRAVDLKPFAVWLSWFHSHQSFLRQEIVFKHFAIMKVPCIPLRHMGKLSQINFHNLVFCCSDHMGEDN